MLLDLGCSRRVISNRSVIFVFVTIFSSSSFLPHFAAFPRHALADRRGRRVGLSWEFGSPNRDIGGERRRSDAVKAQRKMYAPPLPPQLSDSNRRIIEADVPTLRAYQVWKGRNVRWLDFPPCLPLPAFNNVACSVHLYQFLSLPLAVVISMLLILFCPSPYAFQFSDLFFPDY